MPPQNNSNQSTIIKVVAAIVVLGLAGFAFTRVDDAKTGEPVADSSLPNSATANDMTVPAGMTYKNGVYDAMGTYFSPAGEESVAITLTIQNDTVTAAAFKGSATNPGSIKNQDLFKAGFDTYVVGKPVDSIALQTINGSSLTPKGFMDALVKIKAEAKA